MKTPKICAGCQTPIADGAPDGLCPKCLLQAGLGTGFDLGPESQSAGPRPPFVAPAVEEVARLFPQWEILNLIGQGGMGAVYRVRQKELGRVAALKLLPPSVSSDPVFTERFTREARALAQLNHPGIVTLYEFGRAGGLFFFLMEFVDGVNLRQMLGTGRLAPREALAIVPQICDALQYAHDQGIVHRDIKPENLLVDRQGRVKVADFGLAKLVEPLAEPQAGASSFEAAATLTEAGRVMGTPQYMAPEQREHPAAVDHRADIYALGVVLYQMLTGELPGQKIEPPSKKVQIDVRLDAVVLRALEQKPDLRYQQASILKTQVETICATPSSGVGGQPPLPNPERELREKQIIVAGTAILAVCIVACLAMAEAYPRRAFLPLVWTALSALGLVVCGIRFAGYWPFPSLWFPAPNFSSRHLAKGETPEPHAREKGFIFLGIGILTLCFFLCLALALAYPRHSSPFLVYLALSSVGLVVCAIRLAGYWPFPSMYFPRPNYSSRNLVRDGAGGGGQPQNANSESVASPRSASPHFSRMAILGAVWSLFFVLAAGLCVITVITFGSPTNILPLLAWWQWGLALTLLPLGATAPLGTTLLGWIAVAQIRRSAGRLYGLGLAVYDGLVFPLLALDALIGVGCYYLLHWAFDWSRHDPDGGMTIHTISFNLAAAVSFGGCLLVDVWVIRRVWRAVNRRGDNGQPSAPDNLSQPPSPRARAFKTGAAATLVIFAFLSVGLAIAASFLRDQAKDLWFHSHGFGDEEKGFMLKTWGVGKHPTFAYLFRAELGTVLPTSQQAIFHWVEGQAASHTRYLDRWGQDFLLVVGRRMGERIEVPIDAAVARKWFEKPQTAFAKVADFQKFWDEYVAPRVAEIDRTNGGMPKISFLGAGNEAEEDCGALFLNLEYTSASIFRAVEVLSNEVYRTRLQLPVALSKEFDQSLASHLHQIRTSYADSLSPKYKTATLANQLMGLASTVLLFRLSQPAEMLVIQKQEAEQLAAIWDQFEQKSKSQLVALNQRDLTFIYESLKPIFTRGKAGLLSGRLPRALEAQEISEMNRILDNLLSEAVRLVSKQDSKSQRESPLSRYGKLVNDSEHALRQILIFSARNPHYSQIVRALLAWRHKTEELQQTITDDLKVGSEIESALFDDRVRLMREKGRRENDAQAIEAEVKQPGYGERIRALGVQSRISGEMKE